MHKVSASILIVDDDPHVLTAARVVLRQRFQEVQTEANVSRLEATFRSRNFDLILLDMNFAAGTNTGNEGLFWLRKILTISPTQQVILITAYSDVPLAVEAMKSGAADFIVKPWDNDRLTLLCEAAINRKKSNTRQENPTSPGKAESLPSVVGTSHSFRTIMGTITKVAPTDANVLLLGENGTGKEVFARHLHALSGRNGKPFIAVDMGSLAPTLFESELYGHKKGAFTDAREDRVGKLAQAEDGTIFLDEIGNLPFHLQSKLLTVLQSRTFSPVGGNEVIPLRARIVTATNLNLAEAVTRKEFREDLLYRINTIEITIPSLRERAEDIIPLALHFLETFNHRYGKHLRWSPNAEAKLKTHSWPGNVRELEHAVERAVIMSTGSIIDENDLKISQSGTLTKPESFLMGDVERKVITESLARNGWNISKVSKELGLGRTTLYRKMEKYGILK